MPEYPVYSGPPASKSAGGSSPLNYADLAVIGLLLGCVFALFWKVVFTSAMFFYRDVFNYSYPHARFIHETCRLGSLPYWNPYLNYGEPVLANPNFLFFYPYTLILVLLPIDLAYTLHYILHFGVAGAGTYCLARRWGQGRLAAFLAAFIFTFSGPVLSLGNFYNHVAAAAWIPWAILTADRATESYSWRPWILLSLIFTLQFLAAEPFTLLATFGLSIGYALYKSGILCRPLASPNLRIVGRFILVGCLMAALAAVQLFPALDLLQNSRRGTEGLPFNETTSWSFHPLSLIEAVIPGFFGSPLEAPSLWTLVLSCRNMPYFPSIFVGFVPLFFALAGWALGQDRRRRFAAWASVTLLVLSFGRFTPVFALAYLLVPPLALVRFPVKLLVPLALMVALLAGWGFDALYRDAKSLSDRFRRMLLPLKWLLALTAAVWLSSWLVRGWIVTSAKWILLRTNAMFVRSPAGELTGGQAADAADFLLKMLQLHLPGLAGFTLGGIVLLVALRRGRLWAHRAFAIVALLGLAQMAAVNYSANPTVPQSFYSYRPPVLTHFEESTQPYRFSYVFREAAAPSASPDMQGFLNFDSVPEAVGFSSLAQIAFRDRLLLARGSMLDKVEGVSNIDVERSFPPFLYEFWLFALRRIPEAARADCLLGRTNVKYQILRTKQPTSARREIASIFNGSAQTSYLYENLCATPRAYVAGSASYSGSAEETLSRLSSPEFDPSVEVIVAGERRVSPPFTPTSTPGRVEIAQRTSNRVTLSVGLSRTGYVVLLDRFDPNWHAAIDGREVPVLRANQLFRAVHVPQGRHEIRFFYRQRGLRIGAVVSLLTLALLAALYALDHGLGRRYASRIAGHQVT